MNEDVFASRGTRGTRADYGNSVVRSDGATPGGRPKAIRPGVAQKSVVYGLTGAGSGTSASPLVPGAMTIFSSAPSG